MFHPRRHRLTTCLLLAAYLAATTLGGLLHDHGDHRHGDDGLGGATCEHAPHDHDGSPAGLKHATDGKSLHDDNCTVCRFAGQRTMPAECAPLVPLCDLSVDLAVVHPCGPAATIARTLHSRAPPWLG